jgi:hypothetical protein
MSAGTVLAETGAALRSSLAVSFASGGQRRARGRGRRCGPGGCERPGPGVARWGPTALVMTLVRLWTVTGT